MACYIFILISRSWAKVLGLSSCHLVTLSPCHHVILSYHHCWFNISVAMLSQTLTIFLPSTDIHLSPKHWHQHCMWLYLSGCCSVPWLRAILGPSWGHLGAIWGHFVFVLGPSWVHFGAILGFKHGLITIHGYRTEHGYMICVLIINAPVT